MSQKDSAPLILQRRGLDALPKPPAAAAKPKEQAKKQATHILIKADKDPLPVGLVLPVHAYLSDGWEVDVTEIAAALAKRGGKGDAKAAKTVASLNRYQAMQTVCAIFRSPGAEPHRT